MSRSETRRVDDGGELKLVEILDAARLRSQSDVAWPLRRKAGR
jgi:hypothetical protein